jgi:hypothetical protein
MSDLDLSGVGYLLILGVFLPALIIYLVIFLILLSAFSKKTNKNKLFIKPGWKRVLTALILSLAICSLLFYTYIVASQLLTGKIHF